MTKRSSLTLNNENCEQRRSVEKDSNDLWGKKIFIWGVIEILAQVWDRLRTACDFFGSHSFGPTETLRLSLNYNVLKLKHGHLMLIKGVERRVGRGCGGCGGCGVFVMAPLDTNAGWIFLKINLISHSLPWMPPKTLAKYQRGDENWRSLIAAGSIPLISRELFLTPLSSADPAADKKPLKPQIPFSRTPNRQNTLDDDVTKAESKNATTVITKRMNLEEELLCPTEREAKFELFPVICNSNQDCEKVGETFRCCKLFGSKRCHEGLEKKLEDIDHERELIQFEVFLALPNFSLQPSSGSLANARKIPSLRVSGMSKSVITTTTATFREFAVRTDGSDFAWTVSQSRRNSRWVGRSRTQLSQYRNTFSAHPHRPLLSTSTQNHVTRASLASPTFAV